MFNNESARGQSIYWFEALHISNKTWYRLQAFTLLNTPLVHIPCVHVANHKFTNLQSPKH